MMIVRLAAAAVVVLSLYRPAVAQVSTDACAAGMSIRLLRTTRDTVSIHDVGQLLAAFRLVHLGCPGTTDEQVVDSVERALGSLCSYWPCVRPSEE